MVEGGGPGKAEGRCEGGRGVKVQEGRAASSWGHGGIFEEIKPCIGGRGGAWGNRGIPFPAARECHVGGGVWRGGGGGGWASGE